MRRKQKAQGMTEFALILPLLLLLLLGIIEAARVIWAYVTVQQAAREAARYAVTGRPFMNFDFVDPDGTLDETEEAAVIDGICTGTNDEPDPYAPATQPWLCDPMQRLEAIEGVALRRGHTLNVTGGECVGEDEFFNPSCNGVPGAFGVLVEGQVVTGTEVVTKVVDHPGTQGLNVQISTFYNVEMITPVYDIVMGGNFITLRGSAQMQNEGLDAAIGIEPPPGIDPINPNPDGEPDGALTPRIASANGYTFDPSQSISVFLENHPNTDGQQYDVWLYNNTITPTAKICGNVATDDSGQVTISCPLAAVEGAVDPGLSYELYSTAAGTTSPRIATANELVTIIISNEPAIRFVDNGLNTWAANSTTQLELVAHSSSDGPTYEVHLFHSDGVTHLQTIATNLDWNAGPFDWTVFDVVNDGGLSTCNLRSENPCIIRSYPQGDYNAADPTANYYAVTEVYINQPSLVLSPNNQPYSEGDFIGIYLRDHTPGKSYMVKVPQGPDGTEVVLGETLGTNSYGDSSFPVEWRVPASCGGVGAWPDGFYDLTSNEVEGAEGEVARLEDVEFVTNPSARLEVQGGTTWPAGSFINIEVHKHTPDAVHYLEFDGGRVPTGSLGDVFTTSECGFAVIGFVIPADTPAGAYDITSFLDADDSLQATLTIFVSSTPIIEVVQGDKVLPNETITVQLHAHRPDTGYRIIYAEKTLGDVLTDGSGEAELDYDMSALPTTPGPDLSDPSNYGIYFDLYSRNNETDQIEATTQLAIQGADLRVTKIEFPPAEQLKINSAVPVTITVQNVQSVPINSYFDIDLYLNPTPIDPSYYKGFNFPGDVKYWQNSVAGAGDPGDTFIITETFFIGEYGLQEVHAFADTSNFILEGEAANQVANPNNLLSGSFTVGCSVNAIVDTFDAASSQQVFTQNFDFNSSLAGWSTQVYGSQTEHNNGAPKITGGRLELRNDGRSTQASDDNVNNSSGYVFYYRPEQINSADGLDVVVQVHDAPNNARWAKSGIEIRDSFSSSTSPKLNFVLAWNANNNSNRHGVMVGYRDATNASATLANSPVANVDLATGPVWLRVQRMPGSNVFNFYYKQQGAQPGPNDWGTPYFVKDIKLATQVYVGVLNASHSNNTYRSGLFDDFSYTYYVGNPIPGWTTRRYGNADLGFGATISNGQLILQSDGSSNFQTDDNNGGELYFYRTTPVSTTSGLEAIVQVHAVDLVGNTSKGGLEIRSSIEGTTGPKVLLGIMRNNGGSNYIVQPGYRSGGNTVWAPPGSGTISANHQVDLSQPIWLRIQRVAGTNTFNYYYRQSATPPPTNIGDFPVWWGQPFASATVNMSDPVYVGLYNAPYADGTTGQSIFDNFNIFDPSTCEAALGDPEEQEDIPPGLTLCGDPLQDQSFEQSPSKWKLAFEEGVSRSPSSANSGIYKLAAASQAGFPVNPWFYQGFIMGDWVISSTSTFELALSRNINNLGDNQPGDQFYALVTTDPSSPAAALAGSVTTPTVVAQGVMPSGPYDPTRWDSIKVSLPIINRDTIEGYAGQQLYLYLYNNSNALDTCGATTCATEFYFDDVSLNPCTTQPLPDNVETRILGELTLHFSGGTSQKLPYVKVWAYSPGDPTIYETMTLPSGEFNFYNLPATTAGTEYVIFSQYHLIDEFNPDQIETLATQTSTVLKLNVHTNSTPQRVFLDLVTVELE